MKLALIQELVLINATESRQPQLALRIMRQEIAPENYYGRIDESSAKPQSKSVQNVSQIVSRRVGRQPAACDPGLNRPANLRGVKFIDRYVGNLVLPAVPRMRALEQDSLIGLLRHDRCSRPNPLIWSPIVGTRQAISCWSGTQNQNLKSFCPRRYPLSLNWYGRIKAAQNLGQVLKSLIRDCLADNGTIRPNPDQHLSAAAIHEGAKGLAGPGKLSRALLEFKLFGFASSNEVLQLLACHLRKFY